MPVKPLRIAVSDDLGITSISDEVLGEFHQFIDLLVKDGADIVARSPGLPGLHNCFDVLRAHSYAISLEEALAQHPAVMKPEVVWNIESGLALDVEQLRQATRAQGRIINSAADFMKEYDLLICPATSLLSVPAELRYPGFDSGLPIPEYYRWLAIAYATTLTALPVITLPCGISANGMPVGIQLVGKPGAEAQLFRHASALERLTGWSSLPIDPRSGGAES